MFRGLDINANATARIVNDDCRRMTHVSAPKSGPAGRSAAQNMTNRRARIVHD